MKIRPPGVLRDDINPDVIMMVCTAGHIDHGKTALVKLLTGCNTDRLKIEQERGMSIELGFAPCYLGENLCAGIVDVPGHEKFIKNMVAGVSGIEMTILVIAGDDGIMPQTVEHIQIMELLGIRRGIIALTKTDLVSRERIQQLTEEIKSFLKGAFLENSVICPVSSETFEGYPEFYDTLVKQIKSIVAKKRYGIFRMPIERVFSSAGFGTVVTGIPVDGKIEVGAKVEVVPGDEIGKIRGIQCFLRDTSQGAYGQCLALNIPDFNRKPPERGQVICIPGYLKPASIFQVRIKVVDGLQTPLRNSEQIKFHTGTMETTGKVYLLEAKTLSGGESGLATIVVSRPIAVAMNDKFILRRPSPAETIAGGEILGICYEKNRPQKSEAVKSIKSYLEFHNGVDLTTGEGLEKKIEYSLLTKHSSGGSLENISIETLLPVDIVKEHLKNLLESKKIFALSEDYYIHTKVYSSCLSEVESRINKIITEKKLLSLSVGDLHKDFSFPPSLWERIEKNLEDKKFIRRAGNKFLLQSIAEKIKDSETDLLNKLITIYDETGFKSPRPDELPEMLNIPQGKIDQLIEYLYNDGKIIRLSKNVILSFKFFRQAQDIVVKIILQNGKLNSADFKYHIGSSRKYALAILDYLDFCGVTMRIDNDRKLTSDYMRHLI